MFRRLKQTLSDPDRRNLALTAAGMGALALGAGPLAALPFGAGLRGLEARYREKHAFDGTFEQRWARAIRFYDGTHQDPTNRVLHLVGTPFILAGTAGLAVSSPLNPLSWPLYGASVGSFVGGWALNIAGHALFEKNAPAFAEDPLSFVAGPMWEVDILRRRVTGAAAA